MLRVNDAPTTTMPQEGSRLSKFAPKAAILGFSPIGTLMPTVVQAKLLLDMEMDDEIARLEDMADADFLSFCEVFTDKQEP